MELEGLRQRKQRSNSSEEMSETVEKDGTEGKKVTNEGDIKDGHLRDKTQIEEVNEIKAGSYWLTRIVFLRFLGFIYLVAFMVSYHQNKELIGDRGLTPARLYLRRVGEEFPELTSRILHLPTILWFAGGGNNVLENFPYLTVSATNNCLFSGEVSNHGKGGELDVLLDGIALTGAFLAILVMIRGAANMVVMATMWMLYMSIVNVGQNWFSFGWESQLLETGFLAIWAVPILSLSRFLYTSYISPYFPILPTFPSIFN